MRHTLAAKCQRLLRLWRKTDASHVNVSEATGGVYLNKLIVLGKHQHNLLILQALSSVMMSAVGFRRCMNPK